MSAEASAAELLRSERERAGLTQYDLARFAGFPQATISRWESGVTPLRVRDLDAMLLVMGRELVVKSRRDPLNAYRCRHARIS